MTVDAAASADESGHTPLPAPPMAPDLTDEVDHVVLVRTPRAGELSPAWRLITVVTWIVVAVAIANVWKTSDQLGLTTWWLGPRGAPRPLAVKIAPFVPPCVMLVGAIRHWRRLPLLGSIASAIEIGVGAGDLGRVTRLGVAEIAIGVAASAVSIAAFTGTYRPVGDGPARPADT